ncbi:MAG TPA: ketopantoate reductase family protein [Anaerolineales bacterium]|nr:ketopantoate reductase family protein [Anaerolineales bacterium]
MKILIMGTGGVGGYYGGLLAQQGNDLTFIARGAHLYAIRHEGLKVKSVHGDFIVSPASATEDPEKAGHVDLILFCVKTYNTDEAAEAIRPVVGPHTVVMSLQNGIDAAERIGEVVGMEHVIGGATWLSSAVEAPGIIKQISKFRRVVLGELDGDRSARIQSIYEVLKNTGITVEISENIQKVLWTKFVFIAAASGLGSLTRLPMGDFRSVPETRSLLSSIMQEVHAVANAQGVVLDADVVQKSLEFTDNAAPHIKPSMQLDVETGHRTELESMIGVIGRKGRKLGVPTPVADFVYASLLPVELKARNKASPVSSLHS